jgi:4-hydroxy-tetrahydrodipicolinate synthase
MKRFEGVFPPHITPFTKEDEVDEKRLREVVERLIEGGVHGLIACGSSGHGPSLLPEERKRVIKLVVDQVNGRVPVLAGTGCVSTKETIMFSKFAEDVGADGLMIITPFYYGITDTEVYEHFKAVSNSVSIPIMAYNNTVTTKVDIKPRTLAKIAEDGYLSYVKETSGYLQRVPEIIRFSHGKLSVFCGWDDMPVESVQLGAIGWVSGIANIATAECVQAFNLASQKKYAEANAVFDKVRHIAEIMENSGKYMQYLIYGVEAASGKPVGNPRMPLLPLSEAEKKSFKELIDAVAVPIRA